MREYPGAFVRQTLFIQVQPFRGPDWTRLLISLILPHLSFHFLTCISARVFFVKCRSFVFQSGKATGSDSGGVIDLTMDDEESGASQGTSIVIWDWAWFWYHFFFCFNTVQYSMKTDVYSIMLGLFVFFL